MESIESGITIDKLLQYTKGNKRKWVYETLVVEEDPLGAVFPDD
jgi:hypothetical protein